MSRLPGVTGREVIRVLQRAGFIELRSRGSHHFLAHADDPTRWATVPIHGGRQLAISILQSILRSAKLTREEFRDLL